LKEQFGKDFLLVDIVISEDDVRYARMLARGSDRDGGSIEKLREYDAGEEAIFHTSESEKLADLVIKNDGGVDDFYAAIEAFYAEHIAN
jgi:dephospho-CoA kinase